MFPEISTRRGYGAAVGRGGQHPTISLDGRQSAESPVTFALQHGPGVEAALTSTPDPSDVI
jgi:hypothetical protein